MKQFFYLTILMVAIMSIGLMSCSNDDDSNYDGSSKDQHDYVDLRLPSGTLWATTNVGAQKPEDYGDYFAWGETIGYNGGKRSFSWSTYFGFMDDAATANWGSSWQTPSETQYSELINNTYTTTEWTTVNGVNGIKITSKSNKKSIFLPAAGCYYNTSFNEGKGGQRGCYWSRTLKTNSSKNEGYTLEFSSWFLGTYYDGRYRCMGCSIRPVRVLK